MAYEGQTPKASVADAYILFFVSLLLVVTIGGIVQAISIPIGLAFTEISLILLPAVIYVKVKRLSSKSALRLNSVSPGIVIRSVILGVSGWGMATVLYLTTVPVIGVDPSSQWLIEALPETTGQLVVFLIVMAILPGICEETLFRGAIQGTLEKRGAWKAIIYTAVIFACYHMNPWAFIPAAGLGVLFGVVTVRTNSILPAVICHASNNAMGITMAFVYRGDENTAYPLLGLLVVLFALGMWEFFYHTRHAMWQPSPLTILRSSLSSRIKGFLVCGGILLVVLGVTLLVGFPLFFRGFRMTSSELAPEINRGDPVLVLKCRYIDMDIQPGDIIAFKRDGRTSLRKVVRTAGDSCWVVDKSAEAENEEVRVQRTELIGKVIYTFRMSD